MIFFEIIDGILCDCAWYRYFWGGTWYYVRVVIYGAFVTGWIKTQPTEYEEVIETKDFGMGIVNRFWKGSFDESNSEGKPEKLSEGDRLEIEKGKKIQQQALQKEAEKDDKTTGTI